MVLLIGASGAQIKALESSDELEEVIVTAERRTEDLQKTAASITVRSGEELQQQGRYSLADIIRDIPGISGGAATGGGGGGTDTTASGLVIRGIPSNAGPGGSITSTAAAAAIYVDGVYEGVGGNYDIDRVEVLRGPQGTLYGRSATSGVVATHTRNPSLDSFGANATIEGGNYGLRHYSAGVDLPIVSNLLGLRLSGNAYDRDGLYNGAGGATRNRDARAKLLYVPSNTFSLVVGLAAQDNTTHSGGSTVAQSTDRNTVIRVPASIVEAQTEYRQVWLETNWDLSFGTLTYQPALRTYWQDAPIIAAQGPVTVSQVSATPSDDFVTHEIRLASNPDSTLIWQVGALYYDNELSNATSVRFLPSNALGFSTATSKSTKSTGVFAQATYPFTDVWRVTAGVRYDHTKVVVVQDYTNNSNQGIGQAPNAPNFRLPEQPVTLKLSADQGTRKFSDVTYKLRTEHDLTASNLLYASVSTGVSPGDVSVATCPPASTPCVLVVNAETLTAYEFGSKNRFMNDRLQLNGGVFFNDYGAYQVQNIDISGGANPGSPSFATLAVPLESYGFELESLFQLTADDRVSFNFAWIESRYGDKPALFASANANDGIVGSPIKATLAYDHAFRLPGGSSLTSRASARFLSSHEGSLSALTAARGGAQYADINSQWIGDLNLNWVSPGRQYTAGVWVRNVADNRYIQSVGLSIPTAQQAIPPTGFYFTPNQYEPRTVGANFSVNF